VFTGDLGFSRPYQLRKSGATTRDVRLEHPPEEHRSGISNQSDRVRVRIGVHLFAVPEA